MSWDIIEMYTVPLTSKYVNAIGPVPARSKSAYGSVNDMLNVGTVSGSVVAPIVVEPSFHAGMDQQDFLYDFYFRIWVFPARLELRNPRLNVAIPFAIWNAYPYKNTMTAINTLNADGLELDIEPPSLFREIEYRTINLEITPASPLTIEAVYDFVFQQGEGFFTFVASLASVLSIVPDVPVNETWQWLTDLIVATDGTEQRSALRSAPRRKMESKLIALQEAEIRDKMKQFMFDIAGQVVIPYFQYSTTTSADAFIGDNTLLFDPSKTDLRVAEYIFVMTKTDEDLYKVDTLSLTGCILDAPLAIDVPKGSLVVPAFASYIDNRSTISRYAVNEVAEIQVNSLVAQARTDLSRPGSTAVINMYDGYPVLDKRPLADQNPEDAYDSGYTRFDYNIGTIEQVTRWVFTRMEGARQFLIHRAQQPQTMDYWRDFLDASRGMLNPFLVPTFRGDVLLRVVPDDSSNQLIIQGADYASLYWPVAPFKRLCLWTASGAVAVTVSSVSVNPSGDSVANLVTGIPTGDGYRSISMVSYLLKCRLASDEVTLEHHGLETILGLSIRTIPE